MFDPIKRKVSRFQSREEDGLLHAPLVLKVCPLILKLKWFPVRSSYGVRSMTIVLNPTRFEYFAVGRGLHFEFVAFFAGCVSAIEALYSTGFPGVALTISCSRGRGGGGGSRLTKGLWPPSLNRTIGNLELVLTEFAPALTVDF